MEMGDHQNTGHDFGAPECLLKKLDDALLDLASGGAGETENIGNTHLARLINFISGGAVIKPWEIDQLPQEWIDTFMTMLVKMPKAKEAAQEIKTRVDDIKRKHPTYGKRFNQ